MIAVGAIDDDAMLLEGLGAWMARSADLSLRATAVSVTEFLALEATVDLVLLDLNLRDHTTVSENVTKLMAAGHSVVVVSTIPDKEFVIEALEAGAKTYVTKDQDLSSLATVLHHVHQGTEVMTPETAFVIGADRRPRRPQLSTREREVLRLYGLGLTLDSVARRLNIKPGTAREYLARVKHKYAAVGRPTYTKTDLAQRIREDRIELDGIGRRH